MAAGLAKPPRVPRRSSRAATALAGIALLLGLAAPMATASSTDAQDAKGVASARVMFKIVIPPVVIVDKDGTVRSNDRHRLMPVTTTAKMLRAPNTHAVIALP